MATKIIVDGHQHKFSSAHFISGHDKCGRLHGHNFHVRVELSGDLDERHFVVDFIDVKKALTTAIDELDHKVLVPEKSDAVTIKKQDGNVIIEYDNKHYSLPAADVVFLPLPAITSELLAQYLHGCMKSHFPGCRLAVRVGETSSSFAEYSE